MKKALRGVGIIPMRADRIAMDGRRTRAATEEERNMSVGLILLAAVSALVLFGVAQRVLDRMQLTDRGALIIAAAIFLGGLLPEIRLGRVAVNLGGAVVPLAVCVWLLIRTDTGKEVRRALFGSVLTGAAVYALGRLLPSEPEQMAIDPQYLYGIAGGVIAYVLGRSRRAAFICGVLGVILADAATAVINWRNGVQTTLVLGGAGAMDTVVISGILAVLLAELMGEVLERMTRTEEPQPREDLHMPVRRGGRNG